MKVRHSVIHQLAENDENGPILSQASAISSYRILSHRRPSDLYVSLVMACDFLNMNLVLSVDLRFLVEDTA